ncbi:hypothetical protein BHE74_00047014, partial [Ensete ventricosum]
IRTENNNFSSETYTLEFKDETCINLSLYQGFQFWVGLDQQVLVQFCIHTIYIRMYLRIEKGEGMKGRGRSEGKDRGRYNGGGDGASVAEEDEENECTSQ